MKKAGIAMLAILSLTTALVVGCGQSGSSATSVTTKATATGTTNAIKTTAAAKTTSETTKAAAATQASGNTTGNWKASTVTLYVPTKAGNQADLYIRFITPVLEKQTGKKFVVVNQTDGNGVVAYENIRTGKKDGSSLLYFLNSMIVQTHTGVYDKNVSENFTPIAIDTASGGMWLVVKNDSKFQSVKDIIDAVKANPGKVTYGMTSGQALHLLGGMMNKDIGAELSLVDAGGNAERLISLLGGNVDFTFVSTGAAKQYVEKKEIRVLGCVTGTGEKDPLYPDIESVTKLGMPSVKYGFDTMLLGPSGMDASLVKEINAAFQKAMVDPEVVKQFAAMENTMTPLDVEASSKYVKDKDSEIAAIAKTLNFQ